MNAGWLTFQSFQQSQDLLAAINTLSIHTKLELAGVADEERAEAVAKAREKLSSFLVDFGKVVDQAERSKAEPVLGVDPRLRQLARSFVDAKKDKRRFNSLLFTESISRTIELLASSEEKDQYTLLESLADLRVLVEEHVHADASRILGEI